MSPEQVLGKELDARSDIFSFGIVLYEMFTGTKPFASNDTRSVTAGILKDKFIAPRRVNSEIPRGLQRLIKKCLRKKPQRRFGSMLEVEKKLGKRLAGRTTKAASLRRIAGYLVSMNMFEAAPEQETMVVTAGVSRSAFYKNALLALLTILLLASGAALYYYQTRPARQPSQTPLVQPALPPAGTTLVTRPQETTEITPTVPGAIHPGTSSSTGTAHFAPSTFPGR
jgi:serine/threonine protein kinase